MYADKCNKSIEDILDILKAGTWMTAQEAYELGFIDEIIEDDEEKFDFAKVSEKLNVLGMPALPRRQEGLTGQSNDETISILKSLANKVEGFFNSKAKTEDKSNITLIMKKDYQQINAALNVEGIQTDKEGCSTLNGEQLGVLNAKLEEQAKKIAEQQELIMNLQSAPGDSTQNIEGVAKDASDGKGNTAKEMFDRVKNFI
jgi:enoyl-CoA hydratase/carnithine racemase